MYHYYTNKFGKEDGTHIKFIGTGKTKNEELAISEMSLMKHGTPGIKQYVKLQD